MVDRAGHCGMGPGMGWVPDYPDFRDYGMDTKSIPSRVEGLGQAKSIKAMLEPLGVLKAAPPALPNLVDLRSDCSPIEDQENLGSCTAQAGVGLVEYFERKAFGGHWDASRLFLYKVTRNLLGWTGDTGAYLRTTMGAMVLFGVPPERYWEYIVPDFDKEPSAFCYAFAQNYQAIQYFRLDLSGITKPILLKRIKLLLAAKLPSMFGFTVYNSIWQAADDGKIPYPCSNDKYAGGHAVVAVGYDDKMKIKNTNCNKETKGALLIRNSWGTNWGDKGYGWLPYDYVLEGLAVDWWCLLKSEWVKPGLFGLT